MSAELGEATMQQEKSGMAQGETTSMSPAVSRVLVLLGERILLI